MGRGETLGKGRVQRLGTQGRQVEPGAVPELQALLIKTQDLRCSRREVLGAGQTLFLRSLESSKGD